MVVCNVCLSKAAVGIEITELTETLDNYGRKMAKKNVLISATGGLDLCNECKELLVDSKFDELGKRSMNLDKAVVESLRQMAGALDHDDDEPF